MVEHHPRFLDVKNGIRSNLTDEDILYIMKEIKALNPNQILFTEDIVNGNILYMQNRRKVTQKNSQSTSIEDTHGAKNFDAYEAAASILHIPFPYDGLTYHVAKGIAGGDTVTVPMKKLEILLKKYRDTLNKVSAANSEQFDYSSFAQEEREIRKIVFVRFEIV
jgi:hypothetical protein